MALSIEEQQKKLFSQSLRNFLAPINPLLDDDSVSEIMINGPKNIYAERSGKIFKTDAQFKDDHTLAAANLLEAERSGEQIGLLTRDHPEMKMDDAYAIQNAIYRAKLQVGRSVVGWKIGLTSKAMQYALNIDIPDSGILFDNMVFETGATVPKGRFIQPRIEAEIAFAH